MKIMHRWTAAYVAGALVVATGTSSPAQEYRFDLTNDSPPTFIASQGDEYFAKEVGELSDGRISITVHHGGALGYRSKDNLDAVADGAVPIATTFGTFIAGVDPIFNLSSLPFITGKPEDARASIEIARPFIEEAFGKYNQKLLFTAGLTPVGIWSKWPVDSQEALQRLKIRTYDPIGLNTLKTAGAAPIQLSFGDIVPQLATGGINSVFTSAEGGSSSKFWEYLSHFTELNYSTGVTFTHMNLDAYKQLPKELQQVIDEAAAKTEARNWDALTGRVADRYALMRENGVTIVTDIPEEFRNMLLEAAQPEIEKWQGAVGPNAETILSKLRERQ
jgi:TRAP-type transport system periplasmic protein